MNGVLDLDQLRTFIAIAETGSFTRAAETVFKTQSAVSMQIRRLEERIGQPLFVRDGRQNRMTEDGEKLLYYARRLVQMNEEALASFSRDELTGRVRLGIPDDYADRFLPEILARFSRSNPRIEVTVICEHTPMLVESLKSGELDVSIITHADVKGSDQDEIIRREPLLWVTSAQHCAHEADPLPLALGRPTCCWRKSAISALVKVERPHRVLYCSWSSAAVGAVVAAGLAVSILPESALRPGMRVLGENEGFPPLPPCEIALLRSPAKSSLVVDALCRHIVSSLNNISVPIAAE